MTTRRGLFLVLVLTCLCCPAPAGDAEVERKLQALEEAYAAGVLSDAEYRRKKAELEAQLAPKVDEATQKKLAALEAAREAGVLSPEEYERKKAELLGGGQKAPEAQAYRDPKGRFRLTPPPGWTATAFPADQGVAFASGNAAISVLCFDGSGTVEQLLEAITGNLRGQWKGYQELKRGRRDVGGSQAPVIAFAGTNPKGMQAVGQVTAVVTPGRGFVFVLTVPADQAATIEPEWDAVLKSFAAGETKTEAGPANWKTYRHESGAGLKHPQDWKVMDQQGYLQLAPPDAVTQDGAPVEMYVAFGESLEGYGITSPDDPQLLQYLDEQVKSLTPVLERTGAAAPIRSPHGQGRILDWQATGEGGQVVVARCYVVIVKQHVMAVVGFGLKELVAKRDATLRQIFLTLDLQ